VRAKVEDVWVKYLPVEHNSKTKIMWERHFEKQSFMMDWNKKSRSSFV